RSGTGFKFEEHSEAALLHALRRALDAWRDRAAWRELSLRAMQQDFSWRNSARQYADLYEQVLRERPPSPGLPAPAQPPHRTPLAGLPFVRHHPAAPPPHATRVPLGRPAKRPVQPQNRARTQLQHIARAQLDPPQLDRELDRQVLEHHVLAHAFSRFIIRCHRKTRRRLEKGEATAAAAQSGPPPPPDDHIAALQREKVAASQCGCGQLDEKLDREPRQKVELVGRWRPGRLRAHELRLRHAHAQLPSQRARPHGGRNHERSATLESRGRLCRRSPHFYTAPPAPPRDRAQGQVGQYAPLGARYPPPPHAFLLPP